MALMSCNNLFKFNSLFFFLLLFFFFFKLKIKIKTQKGANNMDQHFLNTPMEKNIPMLLGLLGVWNSSFLGYGARGLIAYCEALTRLAAHIQQLDMEVIKHISFFFCVCVYIIIL